MRLGLQENVNYLNSHALELRLRFFFVAFTFQHIVASYFHPMILFSIFLKLIKPQNR